MEVGGNSLIQQDSNTSGADITVGSTNCPLKIQGKDARPTYRQGRDGTYANLALQSDIKDGRLTITVNGTANTFTANQSGNTSITITDTGATSVTTSGGGNAVTDASYNSSTREITLTKDTTFLTSHQGIKTLKTDNTTSQTDSADEAIAGSGTINLHKIAKTGSYNDLLNAPFKDGNISCETINGKTPLTASYDSTTKTLTLSGGK